jgi:hypothetical protein
MLGEKPYKQIIGMARLLTLTTYSGVLKNECLLN